MLNQLVEKHGEAERLYRQALGIFRASVPEESPLYISCLDALSMLCMLMKRNADAEPLLRELVEIQGRVSGPGHPEYARRLNNLASVYQELGRYNEAEPLLRQAVRITGALEQTQTFYARLVANLAELYRLMGRYNEAEPFAREATQLLRDALGEEHFDCARSLATLTAVREASLRTAERTPLGKAKLVRVHRARSKPWWQFWS
jgi:tetratricopeptide (TPR) repeat protein